MPAGLKFRWYRKAVTTVVVHWVFIVRTNRSSDEERVGSGQHPRERKRERERERERDRDRDRERSD